MKPIPQWCEMVRTAVYSGNICMSDEKEEIDKVTEELRQGRVELLEAYKEELLKIDPNMSTEVMEKFIQSSAPRADDIRISYKDVEDQYKTLQKELSPQDLKMLDKDVEICEIMNCKCATNDEAMLYLMKISKGNPGNLFK